MSEKSIKREWPSNSSAFYSHPLYSFQSQHRSSTDRGRRQPPPRPPAGEVRLPGLERRQEEARQAVDHHGPGGSQSEAEEGGQSDPSVAETLALSVAIVGATLSTVKLKLIVETAPSLSVAVIVTTCESVGPSVLK